MDFVMNRQFPGKLILTITNLLFGMMTVILLSCDVNAESISYVTPQMYGAVANGIADDSDALQSAIDSGSPVYLPAGEYYITKPIRVYNKKNLWVQGSPEAVIHRKHDDSERVFLFNLQNCYSCMFRDLNITSDIAGVGSAPNGHTRPSLASSNILAFGGNGNSNIYFYNNTFSNMESDFWFNDPKVGWNSIHINGWISRNSTMALYGQKCTNLTVTNADVILNSETAGDGDHCIYIAQGSSSIYIRDSVFDAGTGIYGEGSPGAVFTFYRSGNVEGNQIIENVTISNCTIRGGRFLYGNCGKKETISALNCNFEQTFSRGEDYTGAFGGDTNYRIINSKIDVSTYTITGQQLSDTGILFYGCDINAEKLDTVCFADPTNLWVYNCNIKVGKMLLYIKEDNVNAKVGINNCSIYTAADSYLMSKRNTSGTVMVSNTSIDNSLSADRLVYNGNAADMSGFTISDCSISGYKTVASPRNILNSNITNTTLNGMYVN